MTATIVMKRLRGTRISSCYAEWRMQSDIEREIKEKPMDEREEARQELSKHTWFHFG